jgi:hypothetical protein
MTWVLNEISAHVQHFGTGPGEVIVTNRIGKVAQRNSFGYCWRHAEGHEVPYQVRHLKGGEPACRPGSVRPLARAGGHPSGTAVAGSLVRSTREHRAGSPRSLAQARAACGEHWPS